jgi:transcriptional regulator of acetoin/glycerol metabolism
VIAATHRNLEKLVRQERFRHDLLARLGGVTLDLPPLRERTEDLPLLLATLLRDLAPDRLDVRFSPEALHALLTHPWPLNVRELRQTLSAALTLSGTGRIDVAHLPRPVVERTAASPRRELTPGELERRAELVRLLREHEGNVAAVARALGKARTQVVRWVDRFAIGPGDLGGD